MQNKLYRFVFIIALFMFGCHTAPKKQLCPPNIPIGKFRPSDIVFRLGRTIESDLIASSGQDFAHYSHVGVIIDHNDTLKVIHIEPSPNKYDDVIKEETLHDFFSCDKSLAGCITRFTNISTEQRNTIQNKALQLLSSSITFDHNYLISDSSTMYCTELIEHIFNAANISLSQGRAHTLPFTKEPIIMPSDIAQNPALATIWSY